MGPVNSPTPAPGGGFGPSQLAGDQSNGQGQPDNGAGQLDQPTTPSSDPNSNAQALQVVVEQVRTMEQGMLGLAQQFPAAAPEVRRAVDSIRAVLQRIVSMPGGQDPPAPSSLA
jgi:hypothetical protein